MRLNHHHGYKKQHQKPDKVQKLTPESYVFRPLIYFHYFLTNKTTYISKEVHDKIAQESLELEKKYKLCENEKHLPILKFASSDVDFD